jgi:ureidoglycolate hydrolase
MHAVQQTTAPAGLDLAVMPLTAEAFMPFGRVIEPTADGTPAGAIDAALDLSHGRPRFYLMDLEARASAVSSITRHRAVTQVLASARGEPWMLAVAPPGAEPAAADVRAFRVPGGVAVLLHRGTWHAGPYFHGAGMAFFNLELADTNVVDHDSAALGVTLRLVDGA